MPDDPTTASGIPKPGFWSIRPRRALAMALGAGAIAAAAGLFAAPDAPWWMPIFLFALAASVVWRLLRPRPRRPGWEDEV